MPTKEISQEMKYFADNLKRTNLGLSFTKKLFTEPEALSPKQILLVMKELGLQIPPEAVVTAEVAQIITSGQAVSEALENGKNLEDVKSATNATAASMRAINAIASKNGWIDQDTASIVSYGTNIGMIIASAGTNVAAWIGLAMDIASTIASKQGQADMRALEDVQAKYKGMITGQSRIFGETFKDFQDGNISIYGLISKMAVETPALWPQVIKEGSPLTAMFPELMMLPTVEKNLWGYGESKIWGNWPWPASGSYVLASWSSSKSVQYLTIDQMNKEQAAEYFFTILLKPWLTVYSIANEEIVGRGNMAMKDIAALSYLVNPQGEISDKDDYVNMLLGANLTPYDFGDPILESIATQYLTESYSGIPHTFIERGVSIGAGNPGFNAFSRDQEIMLQKIQAVKDTDSIWELAKVPYIYSKLQSYMDFEETSFEKDPTVGGKILNQKFSEGTVRAWRKLHNYIAVVQMLSTFKNDSYLKTTKYAQELAPFMPSVESFEEQIKRLNFVSTFRIVNVASLREIATMLGTTPSRLTKLTPDNYLGPAKFTIK